MTDSTRVRLGRAFEALKEQGTTPILVLTGTDGDISNDTEYYTQVAEAAGTPHRWVGAHVGAEEHHGAYWDDAGELRYRHDDSLVVIIWWRFWTRGGAQTLADAFSAEGFQVTWVGDAFTAVCLHLLAVPA